ncbi:hypothetical protein [Arsenicibacter rosenii]|uniref:Uncharacterized protein n=1 Tax=Arsenicibacter rosenii TaxID=1750698 RepID=A0A1S2VM01_9BACT|nr:hypothetical protein [Arsenicibacter rosenii]OIN59783.1 hypothetical protein BLX24_07965 [Arsenicibacter rosenii]
MTRFQYTVTVDMDLTAGPLQTVFHGWRVGYSAMMPPDAEEWTGPDGRLTPEGSTALLHALARGIDAVIRRSKADYGASDAQLLRDTVETLEELFITNLDLKTHGLAVETYER